MHISRGWVFLALLSALGLAIDKDVARGAAAGRVKSNKERASGRRSFSPFFLPRASLLRSLLEQMNCVPARAGEPGGRTRALKYSRLADCGAFDVFATGCRRSVLALARRGGAVVVGPGCRARCICRRGEGAALAGAVLLVRRSWGLIGWTFLCRSF